MLQYSPWRTEQTKFDPQNEVQAEEQLAFSNGYISQYAFFEEPYSGEQRVGTFIDGIHREGTSSPLEIPNPSIISLRLGDERLDLNNWQVEKFYRCLHKGETRLERNFTATSPKGFTIEAKSERRLSQKNPHILEITYTVKFVNYEGLISFMSLMGGTQVTEEWLPLQTFINDDVAYMWLQASEGDVQVCAAQKHDLMKNGVPDADRPMKIDKKRVLGFAFMTDVKPGDTFTMKSTVAIVDSRTCPKSELPERAMEALQNDR